MFGEKAAPAPNRNWTKTQIRTAERRPYLQKKRLDTFFFFAEACGDTKNIAKKL